MKQNVVTAEDVSEATGRSVEDVTRVWRKIGADQREVAEERGDER